MLHRRKNVSHPVMASHMPLGKLTCWATWCIQSSQALLGVLGWLILLDASTHEETFSTFWVLTGEEANALKLTARIPSDHSWETGSNCPYSWPMVMALGFITVIWTLFSSISPWVQTINHTDYKESKLYIHTYIRTCVIYYIMLYNIYMLHIICFSHYP